MDWKEDAWRYAVKNAYLHNGKADASAVVGKILALHKGSIDLKKIMPELNSIIKDVNALSPQELEQEYKSFEGSYELKPKEKEEGLAKLDWASKEKVVTRYAPNPNGPFHLGNSRAAILSHEYARMYKGKFILRFDDTDPKVKKPMKDADKVFRRDLEWLGCKIDELYFASDRLELYYNYMKKLVDMDKAYVCTCTDGTWKEKIDANEACPCRLLPKEENKSRLEKMFTHELKEGEAVLRIKTDLNHPDPSIRDWWAAKIVDAPEHPRVGSKFHVWPSYNLASAIDDHELGVTLIIRGQEHEQNMTKQKYLYEYFGWEYPHAFHFGRIKLGNMVLSTSKIQKGIEEGEYSGWDDPRLGTIVALHRRGFDPRALKDVIMELGTKPVDASIDERKLYDLNKKYIEPKAHRFTYIENPIYLDVVFAKAIDAEKDGITYHLDEGTMRFIVSREEIAECKPNTIVRLRNAYNIRITNTDEFAASAEFVSTAKLEGKKMLRWILEQADLTVLMPDNLPKYGISDYAINKLKTGEYVYFDKFGYCIVEGKERNLNLVFTHP